MPEGDNGAAGVSRPSRWRRQLIGLSVCLVVAVVAGICAVIVPDQVRIVSVPSEGAEAGEEYVPHYEPLLVSVAPDAVESTEPEEVDETRDAWRAKADELAVKVDEIRAAGSSMSYDAAQMAMTGLLREALDASRPYRERGDDDPGTVEFFEWYRFYQKAGLAVCVEHQQWYDASRFCTQLGTLSRDKAERDAWWDDEVRYLRKDRWRGRGMLMKRSVEQTYSYWNHRFVEVMQDE